MADFSAWGDIGKIISDNLQESAQRNADAGLVDVLANGAPQTPAAPAPAMAPRAAAAPSSPTPADQNFDLAARTIIGEAGNQGPQGMAAVAHVIKNRSDQSGLAPGQVVLAPGQFEPWNNPQTRAKLAVIDPNSPEYQQALAIVKATWGGQLPDPTGGATHFFAPKAQAALGRDVPAWAQGQPGQDIGDQRFYNLGYSAPGGAQPQAPQAQPQGQPQQPQAAPQGGGLNPALADKLKAMIHAGGASRQYAEAIMQKYIAPQYGFQTMPDGTVVRTNPNTGTVEPIYESNKPQFTKIGSGIMGDQYGFVDLNKRTINGQPAGQAQQQSAMVPNGPDGQPLQGQDLLAHLEKTDPAVAAGVKSVLAGNLNASSRNLQKLLPIAALVEPGFTQQDYQTRLGTARDFASGSSAKQVKAANQAITHAEFADSLIDKLGNSSILPGYINPVVQGFKNNTGDTAFQATRAQYNDAINALAGELTKTFRGSSGALADIEHWRQSAGATDAPAAMHAHIQAGMTLLNGALEALGDQYNRGMRSNKEPIELLSPRNQGAFQRLMGGQGAAPAAQDAPAAAPALPKITDRASANAAIGQAKAAIASGAPRDAVIQRLQQMGVPPAGL